jgi:ATP-dependent Clp protease ATP-binding subunit ClpA
LQLQDISQRLRDQSLTIVLSDAALDWLVEKGYDPQFGARPMRRTLQRFVESPLSKRLLRGEFQPGDTVVVIVEPDEDTPGQTRLGFERQPQEPIAVELPLGVMNQV